MAFSDDPNWLGKLLAAKLGRSDLMPKRGDDGYHGPVPEDDPEAGLVRSWERVDPEIALTRAEQAWADRKRQAGGRTRPAPAEPADPARDPRALLRSIGVPGIMADEVADLALDPGHPGHPWNQARDATSRRLAADADAVAAADAAEDELDAARAARDGRARAAARQETRVRLAGERQAALDSATGVTRLAAYEETRRRLEDGRRAMEAGLPRCTEFRPEFR